MFDFNMIFDNFLRRIGDWEVSIKKYESREEDGQKYELIGDWEVSIKEYESREDEVTKIRWIM